MHVWHTVVAKAQTHSLTHIGAAACQRDDIRAGAGLCSGVCNQVRNILTSE